MKVIKALPDLPWTPHAREEIAMTGPALVAASQVAYAIGNVAIAGLIYTSFTSPPWFWFGLTKNATIRDLIDFRALREQIPQGAETAVRSDFEAGHRFASFYGFSRTGQVRDYSGATYDVYRRD